MQNNTFKMVIILTFITCIAAVLPSYVYSITKEPIAEAYRQEFLRGLKAVLPEFDNEPDVNFREVDGRKLYLAKKEGEVIAYAMRSVSEKGYSGKIFVLIGVDLEGKLTGVEILQHAETPGLGDKIQYTEFKNSFKGLTVNDKIAVKKDGGIIDQFSGATISPRAVSEAVTSGLTFITNKILHKQAGE